LKFSLKRERRLELETNLESVEKNKPTLGRSR